VTERAGDPSEADRRVSAARSCLFVPADRPDRVDGALRSGADAVIVDLEDSVRPDGKAHARAVVRNLGGLAPDPARPVLLVRVNAFVSPGFTDDVRAAIAGGAAGVVLPKFVPGPSATRTDEALTAVEAASGRPRLPVIGLIESAAGVLGLFVPAPFPARLIRLAFGAADLHADLAIAHRGKGIHTDLAMAALVLASAAGALAAPLDSPHFALDDDGGLAEAVSRAREAGFGGKLCVHPAQLTAVHAGFGISDAERAWAENLLTRWNDPSRRGAGAIQVDGELVDEAMVRRARQIVAAT
jgi:citrate lyase subunit beta/citryl-CoA lyase